MYVISNQRPIGAYRRLENLEDTTKLTAPTEKLMNVVCQKVVAF
jgi:hypothetical protein